MSHRFGTGRKKHIFFAFLLFIVLAVIAAIGTGDVGVSQHRIEKDARQKQKIDENWLVAKDITDELGAMLFYDETSGSHVFSVYLKRGGLSWGYFFRDGGTLDSVSTGIQGFSYGEQGMALLSMNHERIEKIRMSRGQKIEMIEIDPEAPFAVVIPGDTSEVELLNSRGESVPIKNILGRQTGRLLLTSQTGKCYV